MRFFLVFTGALRFTVPMPETNSPAADLPVIHFPAPVTTSAGMTDARDFLPLVAPGMLVEVVFFDEGLACGCTETFTILEVSANGMVVISESSVRFGVNVNLRRSGFIFGRKGVSMPPVAIVAVRTLAHTP